MKYDNDYTLWLPNLLMISVGIALVAFLVWGVAYTASHETKIDMTCVRGHDEYYENQGVKFLCDEYEKNKD